MVERLVQRPNGAQDSNVIRRSAGGIRGADDSVCGDAALDGGNEPCRGIPKERERERGKRMRTRANVRTCTFHTLRLHARSQYTANSFGNL